MTEVVSVPRLPFYKKLSHILVALVVVGYLLVAGKEILSPLISGLLFAILLLPVSVFLEKKMKFSRGASASTSVLLLLICIAALLLVLAKKSPELREMFAFQLKT